MRFERRDLKLKGYEGKGNFGVDTLSSREVMQYIVPFSFYQNGGEKKGFKEVRR